MTVSLSDRFTVFKSADKRFEFALRRRKCLFKLVRGELFYILVRVIDPRAQMRADIYYAVGD